MNYVFASARLLKYKVVTITILKAFLEYFMVGTFLFAITRRNNIMGLIFIPIAGMCVFYRLTLKMSWFISSYMWFWFLIQYMFSVSNISGDSVPQDLHNSVFIKAFRIRDWPMYKILLEGWEDINHWAHYFSLESSTAIHNLYMLDIGLLLFHAAYFQHFCHTAYSLSSTLDLKKKKYSRSKETTVKLESPPNRLIRFIYKFFKILLFVYSHIFTLFCLVLITSSTEGIISIGYIFFTIISVQTDLFSNIGFVQWKLPNYFRFFLKPYIVLDLLAQLIYQYPWFILNTNQRIMKIIGIYDISQDSFSISIKIFTFTVILYQNAIYESKEYSKISQEERIKTMALVI